MKIFIFTIFLLSYPALTQPSSIELDILQEELIQQLENNQYTESIKTIEKIEQLSLDIPIILFYYKGMAFYETGKPVKALAILTTYAEATGKSGRYYKEAISYIVKARKVIKKTKEEAKRLAEVRKERAAKAERRRQGNLLELQRKVEAAAAGQKQKAVKEEENKAKEDIKFILGTKISGYFTKGVRNSNQRFKYFDIEFGDLTWSCGKETYVKYSITEFYYGEEENGYYRHKIFFTPGRDVIEADFSTKNNSVYIKISGFNYSKNIRVKTSSYYQKKNGIYVYDADNSGYTNKYGESLFFSLDSKYHDSLKGAIEYYAKKCK
jgi:hypothetical protein